MPFVIIRHFVLEEGLGEMKWNEPAAGQTRAAELYSWQKANHRELRTAHLHTLKREALVKMRSLQKGAQFLRAPCPFDSGTISLCVYIGMSGNVCIEKDWGWRTFPLLLS